MIGQSAEAKPSSAEVTQSITGICHSVSASTAAMASAARHALWPGILSAASAMISQMIGSRVNADCSR